MRHLLANFRMTLFFLYLLFTGFEYSNNSVTYLSKRLDLNSLKDIITNCVTLVELNMDYIMLCDEAMSFLCNNLTTTLEKLR